MPRLSDLHRPRFRVARACAGGCALLLAVCALAAGEAPPEVDRVDAEARRIDLDEALRLAFTQGRSKRTSDEDLALIAHRLRVVRRDYGPRLAGSVDGTVSGTAGEAADTALGAEVSVAQDLPTAGTVRVRGSSRRLGPGDGEGSFQQDVEVVLTQPLLRDAGQLVWREDLTAAERAYLYAERGHVRFLQDLCLEVADAFWRLQVLQNRVASGREEVRRTRFGLDQARAFLDLGRTTANDVFRAEVALLRARQSLVDVTAAYYAALDGFKLDLNLPVDAAIAIVGEPPDRPLLAVDSRRAIDIALERRLDLMTARDRVADARRAVVLARRGILPDLDLDARVGWSGDAERPWEDGVDGRPDYAVGLTLEIPFERHRERFDYAERLTALSQARRAADLREAQVIREVQAALRDLRQSEVSLTIQRRTVAQSRKRLVKSQMDFEAGAISNRDLLEAQRELLDAEVAYFRARIDYLAAELRLRRETGVFTVDAAGRWRAQLPAYLAPRDGEAADGGEDGKEGRGDAG